MDEEPDNQDIYYIEVADNAVWTDSASTDGLSSVPPTVAIPTPTPTPSN